MQDCWHAIVLPGGEVMFDVDALLFEESPVDGYIRDRRTDFPAGVCQAQFFCTFGAENR